MTSPESSNLTQEESDALFEVSYSVRNECFEIKSVQAQGAHLLFVISHSGQVPAMDIQHVFTPPKYRGKGVAECLAVKAIEICRNRHWKVIPTCSYIRETFMERHPELASEFLI
jgi:predicted GNAT family acetyltransferase